MIVTFPTFLIWLCTTLLSMIDPQRNVRTVHTTMYINRAAAMPGRADSELAGLAWTTDEGVSWKSAGWRNINAQDFCGDPRDRTSFYLACDNGILKSTDNGSTLRLVSPWHVHMVRRIAIHPAKPGRIIACTAKGVYLSTDEGQSWHTSSSGLESPDATFISTICFPDENPDRMIIGTETGLYRSDDGGSSWSPSALPGMQVRDIVRHPKQGHILACATARNGVFLSRDGGSTWTGRSDGLPIRSIPAVAFDPRDEKVLYCAAPAYGVFQSLDQGNTWAMRSRGLTNLQPTVLHIDESDGNVLFLGTKGGVFISMDRGNQWKLFGLSLAHITSLHIQ